MNSKWKKYAVILLLLTGRSLWDLIYYPINRGLLFPNYEVLTIAVEVIFILCLIKFFSGLHFKSKFAFFGSYALLAVGSALVTIIFFCVLYPGFNIAQAIKAYLLIFSLGISIILSPILFAIKRKTIIKKSNND